MQNLKSFFSNKKIISVILAFSVFLVIFLFWKKINNRVDAVDESNSVVSNLTEFDDETEFKFAIIGDVHYKKEKDEKFNKLIKSIEKQKPDLVLTIGDNLSSCNKDDCKERIENWKKDLKSLKSKIFITLGNHDLTDGEEVLPYWTDTLNIPENGPEDYKKLVYSFDYGNSHFVVLESNLKEHFIDDKQLKWLENDLKDNSKQNTFIFYHEPAFPIKSKVDESLDHEEEQRDKLWKIIDEYNVTAVFSGHEHLHSRRLIDKDSFPEAQNKIYQFIVGNTNYFDHEHKAPKELSDVDGLEFVSLEKVFLMVEVKGEKVEINLYSIEGKLLDSFELR